MSRSSRTSRRQARRRGRADDFDARRGEKDALERRRDPLLDIYRARPLVTERLQLARQRLPAAACEPQIATIAAPTGALLKFCITYPEGSDASARAVRAFAEWQLRPRVLAIPGVAQVMVHGGQVERVEVVVAGPLARRDATALRDFPIATARGNTVPLSALALIEEAAAPALVQHEGGQRRTTIGVGIAGMHLSRVVDELERRLAALELPRGGRIEVGGEAVARREAAFDLIVLGAGVLLGIVVLLGAAFSSLRDAGIVLINLPLGLVGGVAAASVQEHGLSVAGFVGLLDSRCRDLGTRGPQRFARG